MMNEAAEVKRAATPHEMLLVADSLTGQDAVNLARSFDERVGLTGIVLTRVDGDGRGGAALSMRAVTGKPIKLIGTGERMDALEDFDPARIADRILGMGDIVSLVEKAATSIDREQAMRAAERMRKGQFDLSDLREQLAGMAKMGGMSGLMAMMPGVAKIKNQMAERNLDDGVLKRQMAIIDSMTPGERKHPDILKASRKKRIAAGAGTKVEEVNKLLKMHRTMADMMKAMGGGKARGPMAGLARMMGMGGGMPSPEEMAKLAEKMPGGLPPGMPGHAADDAGRLRASGPRQIPRSRRRRRQAADAGRTAGRLLQEEMSFQNLTNANPTQINRNRKELPMPVVIRMARAGTKKRPFYHIVAADSRSPRDGRFIERLGYFNPLLPKDKEERLKLDMDKVKAWMVKGAQPSDRVMRFLDAAGVAKREKRNNPERAIPRKERKAAREEKQKVADAAKAEAKTKADAKVREDAARRRSREEVSM